MFCLSNQSIIYMNNLENIKEKLAKKIKQAALEANKLNPQLPPNPTHTVKQQHPPLPHQKHEEQFNHPQPKINQDLYPKTKLYYQAQEDPNEAYRNFDESIEEELNQAPFGADYAPAPVKQAQQEKNDEDKRQFLQKKNELESWLKPRVEPFLIQNLNENNNQEEIEKQIQTMLRQPQQLKDNEAINTNNEDEQTEKYKLLMLNTIKNKNKTKHKRRPEDKPTPFEKLSPPYQQIKKFASYLPRYEQRRNRQLFGNTVDLGVRTLHEVVLQCYLEGIISKNVLLSIDKMSVEKELEFIKKFSENRLDQYEFKSVKFTPLDYRRLCTILIIRNRQKYTMGQRIYCVFKQITDFYHVLYQMQEEQYNRLSNSIIMTYKLDWWTDILKRQQNAFQNVNDNIDTSTVYQPPLSPLFGADINDPENDFFKAKKKHFPNKVSDAKLKKYSSSSIPEAESDEENSYTERNMSRNLSGMSMVHESQENSSYDDDNTKKRSEFSERPSFNNSSDSEDDSDEMSEFSSLKKPQGKKILKKKSVSDSNWPVKEGFSSANSSRFDQSEDSNSEMSESISEGQVDSSMLDSLSVNSMALRKKKGRSKGVSGKRGRAKSVKKKGRKDSDISVSGSLSDQEKHNVFMGSSSSEQIKPNKRRIK